MSGGGGGRTPLAVLVDGVAMPEDEARAVWSRFSDYMEAHRGDLGGFAKSEGYVSAHPRSEGGRATLVLSRSAPQEAYGTPPKPSAGSKPGRPAGGGAPQGRRRR